MEKVVAVLNGDQVYVEELIRENARLAVQHEADRQPAGAAVRAGDPGRPAGGGAYGGQSQILDLQAGTNAGKSLADKLLRAVSDLHFVMAGGDPCKVCGKVCMMGTTKCEPVWKGEKTEG